MPAARHYAMRAVRPSPARVDAPEPAAWLPLPDLDELPSIEELLAPENLVESGQTIAINDAIQALLEPTLEPEAESADSIAAAYEARRQTSARVRSIRVRDTMGQRRAARLAKRRRHLIRTGLIGTTVVALVVAMLALFITGDRNIRLDLDGTAAAISTRSVTVAELLRERGVVLAEGDLVTPALDAELSDGAEVRVRRARDLVLDIDGTTSTRRATAATVEELRAELGLAPELVSTADATSLDPTKPIVLRTPRAVTVVVDGSTTTRDTTALTPREFLAQAKIDLGPNDEVTPGLDERLPATATISIIRLADGQRTEVRPIPFATQERTDASLAAGARTTVQAGQAGSQRLTYRQVIRNGVVVGEQLISTVTVKAPVTQIVAVGRSGSRATPAPSGGRSGSESGQATWYAYTPGTCAHKTLPKGTVLTVTNLATGASTTCVVADRGPYAAGRIVDLTPSVFSKLAPLSSGVIDVRIEW